MVNSDPDHWQDTVGLLQTIKNDYELAKKQLEIAYEALCERERAASRMLAQATLLCQGYSTLCLVVSNSVGSGNRIGQVVLGKPAMVSTPPRELSLDVRCFDRLEVYYEGKKLEKWQNANARSLFRLFITRPREPIIRDVITEYLWPQSDPKTANNNLKVAVHGLRKILNRFMEKQDSYPSVIFNSGSYQINPEIKLRTDVEEFEEHWKRGRQLEKDGKPAAAFREFELAEILYSGDYLEDEPYDDTAFIRRETLKDIYLIILGKLADHLLDQQDYEGSIVYCQKIIRRDHYREDAYRRLMRCYYGLENRNRAIQWYDICAKAIKTGLDTTPEQKTVDLYRQLFRNEPI